MRALADMMWAAVGWARRQVDDWFPHLAPRAAVTPVAAAVEPTTTSVSFETSPRIGETQGAVLVPIVRTGDLNRVTIVEYGITADTATAGVDYLGTSGTVTMDVGVQRVYVSVPIIDDTSPEPTETFVVSIVNVEGGTLLFPRTARIEILDDENPVVDPTAPPLTSDYVVTEEVVISGSVTQPLSFEFSRHDPSLIYVAEKGGTIKVFDIGSGNKVSTFVDISAKVNNIQDRGLMDIALHPNFGQPVPPGAPEHNYLYAFYVVDPPQTAGQPAGTNAGPDGGGNRFAYLVRFTADAATNYTTAVPGSEVIMLGGVGVSLQDISGAGAVDSTSDISLPESGLDPATGEYVDDYIKVDSRSHAGGSLAFGPDGALYVSIGDGTSFDVVDPRSVSVQNLDSLSGKILRIDPVTGLGLPDNPFVQAGDDLDTNRAKVYQLGLRNPFSIGFAADGRLFITNTGWFSWEEIESGYAGANFGWPYFEGGDNDVLLPTVGYQELPGASAFYAAVGSGAVTVTPAYRAFSHDENAPGYQVGAIVGVPTVAYTGTRYPAEFQNSLFFTDVNDGEVYIVDVNDRSKVTFLYQSQTAPVAFSQGPDGYMYVANLYGDRITRLIIEPKPPAPAVGFVPRGSAGVVDGGFVLTSGAHQAGTVMSQGRIDVRQDFTLGFEVNLGDSDGGADGVAVVLHNDARGVEAVGIHGTGLGVGGIADGLAIEFDTYYSSALNLVESSMPGVEIADDHTGFVGTDTGFASTPVALPDLEDGDWHAVVVHWDADAQTLSYTLDGQAMGTLNSDIVTEFLGGSDFAHIGIGAGTGSLTNPHAVRGITITATAEGQPPANTPPLAVADTATTAADTAVTITVLGNDSDPDGDPLTVSAVTNVVGGSTTINADNTVTFTPTAGFSGAGGFTYSVSDGTATGTAPVVVTVTAAPDAVGFVPRGSAGVVDGGFVLTSGAHQAGTVMSQGRIDVRQDFTLGFEVNLGDSDGGADGVAVVLHNDARGVEAVGIHGTGLGVGGIADGLAIEFDTYYSSALNLVESSMPGVEIADDHTGFVGTDTGFASTPVALPDLEDGDWHAVVVHWDADAQTLSYTLDGQAMGTLNSDIVTEFLGGSDFAHIGIGAGTGSLTNPHAVRGITITATAEVVAV
ncbi:lectin-like domain-containing protein [Mycolicibacterium flavescens]|nr:PQQ-dependent sugar dehydrogenase [Mycolicibacterium flavescens]